MILRYLVEDFSDNFERPQNWFLRHLVVVTWSKIFFGDDKSSTKSISAQIHHFCGDFDLNLRPSIIDQLSSTKSHILLQTVDWFSEVVFVSLGRLFR